MKICTKCKTVKSFKEFYKRTISKDGLALVCKECSAKYKKEYFLSSKNREVVNNQRKRWRRKNVEVYKKNRDRWNVKARSKPGGRLRDCIAIAIGRSLKGLKSGRSWESLVGYTLKELQRHLEKQFKNGMSWDNYGTYWHIDHKIPIVVFNFEKSDDLDFKRCWSLKNLQPLLAIENYCKGAKISTPFQPSLTI